MAGPVSRLSPSAPFPSSRSSPGTQHPKSGTRIPHPESRIPNPETRIPKPKTRNPKSETQNPKSETRNPKPLTLNLQPSTLNPQPSTLRPQAPNPEPSNVPSAPLTPACRPLLRISTLAASLHYRTGHRIRLHITRVPCSFENVPLKDPAIGLCLSKGGPSGEAFSSMRGAPVCRVFSVF